MCICLGKIYKQCVAVTKYLLCKYRPKDDTHPSDKDYDWSILI